MKIKVADFSTIAILVLIVTTAGCGDKSQNGNGNAAVGTATGVPQSGSYQPESACDLPYYPRRAGVKSETRADGAVITAATDIEGDFNHAIATVTTTSPSGLDIKTYECTADGITWKDWKLYDTAHVQVMNTLSYTGVFFPSAEGFVLGAKWEYSIVTHKTLDSGWLESETKRNCIVAGKSSVEYQGQTVDALRVDCVDETKDLKASDEATMEHYFDLFSFYYVYGLGVVGYKASE
jgi:hypothetical protein